MPRRAVVVLALALVTTSGTPARSQGAAPPGFRLVARDELYSGVEYLKLAKPTVPVVAHVAHVAPGAPVDLRVVNAYDKVSTTTRELETTSSMCRRVRCVVGVNGDFHKAGTPAGAVVVDGRMLHSPEPGRPQLTVTTDGRLVAGPLPWSGSLTANWAQIAVAAINDAPPADGLAVYTPAYGARTAPSARTELVVGAAGGVGMLNQPATLELRGVRSGAGPIPADGAVLSAEGVAGQQLRDIWTRRQPGAAARAQLVVSSPVAATVSLGAEPVVLRDGKRAMPWRDPNLIYPRQPHTLVGWNKTGDTYLVAVDGRQPGSEGVTMAEAADFLLGLGVTDAVNLDGGGGTTFVAGGSVWNRPSDNDPVRPVEYEERGGTNALVVTSRPGAPLPPVSPAAPTPVATGPSATTGPDWPAGGPDSEPWVPGLPDGVDGGPVGPVISVGGQLAAGDLPLGPASSARGAAGSALPGAIAGTGPEDGSEPSEAGAVDSAGGAELPRGGPRFAATTLTRHVVGAAVGGRWAGPRFVVITGVAGVALILVGTRGKRRHRAGPAS